MKIWVIMAQENPSQNRDGKRWRSNTLAEYLADRNHEVIRWRSSFSHQKKIQLRKNSVKEKHDNYFHQFIKSRSYKRHISLKRFLNHIDLGRNFKKISKTLEKPDFVHIANVPIELAYKVALFCFYENIPYIIDIRDLWPDIYVDLIPIKLPVLKKIATFFLAIIYDKKLNFIFKNAIGITALTESFLKWGLIKAKRKRRKTDYILPMSYEKISKADVVPTNLDVFNKYNFKKDNIIISYSGTINYQHNFRTIFEAAKKLEKDNLKIIFIFAGSGPILDKLKKDYSYLKNVRFTNWLDGNEFQEILEISSIGLIIYKKGINYRLNIPNKFPEYLSFGNAIACGTEGEMSNLVDKHKIGFNFDGENPEDFIRKLKNFLESPKNIKESSKSALALHEKQFLLSVNYPKYCDFIESLLN